MSRAASFANTNDAHFTHLVNRVDYRHALPIFHITSTYRACPAVHRRADGFGLYGGLTALSLIELLAVSAKTSMSSHAIF